MTYSICLSLTYYIKHDTLQVHPCCDKWQNFILFYGWVIFHCVYVPHLLYPFLCRWTIRLFPCLGNCEQNSTYCLWMYICLKIWKCVWEYIQQFQHGPLATPLMIYFIRYLKQIHEVNIALILMLGMQLIYHIFLFFICLKCFKMEH